MTKILEKRRSLHRNLELQKKQNQQLQYQLSQLQALANLGTSTAMIAHEINNLLTPLQNYAQLALYHPDDSELTKKALEKTLKNTERAIRSMQSILNVSNNQNSERKPLNLLACIKEIFDSLCRDFSKDNIQVILDIPENLQVHVVEVDIQQLFMNLILNARDAMLEKGGTLKISAKTENSQAIIELSDTGTGIKPENIEKIFNPFFTTKNSQNTPTKSSGTGLGLAFCKKVADQHNGTIEVNSIEGKMTEFRIILPNSD